MKLNCKRIDFTYTPGEEIFTFPDESGLPFLFDVEKELTADVGPDIAADLFPGTDPSKLSFTEMVDFLRLKRFGSLVDDEMDQQVFIMDLSFNPEITDELMVIYFDLNQEIFCITHES